MIESIQSWKKGEEVLEPSEKIIMEENTLTVRWVGLS
jgi:hypothetical protein